MQHTFHMHGHHFQVIASDGRPLSVPMEKDTINIGPGERYDILRALILTIVPRIQAWKQRLLSNNRLSLTT